MVAIGSILPAYSLTKVAHILQNINNTESRSEDDGAG